MPTFFRGRVEPPNIDHLRALSYRRHAKRFQALGLLAPVPPPTWDSVAMGWVGPVKDQSQCGSCWDFSGTGTIEIAYNKAGVGGGPGVFVLSEEYFLSCQRSGGCNGDDNTNVLGVAKATGLPLSADYGPYTARSGQCAYKPNMTLFKIDDWGFVDHNGGSGVTPTNDIKLAIMEHGAVGCAVAAGPSWDSWSAGTVHHGNSTNIDHDVILVGWDDSKGSRGAWKMRNSWGTSWADGGYGWIEYGADSIGTEAVFALLNAQAPPIDWGDVVP